MTLCRDYEHIVIIGMRFHSRLQCGETLTTLLPSCHKLQGLIYYFANQQEALFVKIPVNIIVLQYLSSHVAKVMPSNSDKST